MDWLSGLLEFTPIEGHVDFRCLLGAPWEVRHDRAPASDIPYHVLLRGSAILEDGEGPPQPLRAGDIVLFPRGAAHRLHDGSGAPARPPRDRQAGGVLVKDSTEGGEPDFDMLCGRFVVRSGHDRLLRDHLPATLVVRTHGQGSAPRDASPLTGLIGLMRAASLEEALGGRAYLNALSAALFALVLRFASAGGQAPHGLLALASQPRLRPALTAMVFEPGKPWTLPELASLCNMSRATFARQFQDSMGQSAADMLAGIRMARAARLLSEAALSTGAVADAVGYQSEAAFQRAFKQRTGMTPARWRAVHRPAAGPEPDGAEPLNHRSA
ncbi:AraC family transcriptional regulator [Bordetella genomosp. 9]|uniref:HTH araC/xylS-type domain-containing protein n=1 Tax=Bordetella genomosp. 9 TaxID=1416803 RepID=A0A1W6YWK6_9BORD|nr:AraC family transcriptional regulator [Bordetella genomosp. 9]ARP85381.1 hypothetical protein CAL13_03470 [Bordetella genomosp. 9]